MPIKRQNISKSIHGIALQSMESNANFPSNMTSNPSTLTSERSAFEARTSSRHPVADLNWDDAAQSFVDDFTQALWLTWLDRASTLPSSDVPAGYCLAPIEPSNALLMSMAIRYDHALALPGYYDQFSAFMAKSNTPDGALVHVATHAQRLASTLSTMRQLHEEVVGKGFYNPLDESRHQSFFEQNHPST